MTTVFAVEQLPAAVDEQLAREIDERESAPAMARSPMPSNAWTMTSAVMMATVAVGTIDRRIATIQQFVPVQAAPQLEDWLSRDVDRLHDQPGNGG